MVWILKGLLALVGIYVLRIVVNDQPCLYEKVLKLFFLKSSFIEIYFVHELFVFQLSFNSSLYILDLSPLLATLFPSISSQFVAF